jgi:hypothetical protein
VNTATVRHYKLLSSALPAEQRRILSSWNIRTIVLVGAVAEIVSALLSRRSGFDHKSIATTAVFIALLVAYSVFSTARYTRRFLAKYWQTYDLEIGPDYLLRRQEDLPDLRLHFGEIARVERLSGRYVHVIGGNRQQCIEIYEALENFDDVLRVVSAIRPITFLGAQWPKRSIYGGLWLAAFMTMLWSRSPFLVAPLAAALLAIAIHMFVRSRRDPNMPRENRRLAWLWLAFAFVSASKLLGVIALVPMHR